MKIPRRFVLALALCSSVVYAAPATPTSASSQASQASVSVSATPKKYAVLSLIGDAFTVVTYKLAAGSSLDQNVHTSVPLSNPALDHTALFATEDAIHRLDASAVTVLLNPSTVTAYTQQTSFINDTHFSAPEWLAQVLNGEHATHLILITKLRAETNIRMANGAIGAGKLDGVGFYVDNQMPTQRSDNGEHGIGFLAPYTYFKVSLIDLATSTVIKERRVKASRSYGTARNKEALTPWDALTASQKLNTLQAMIKREANDAIPALLQTP